MACILVQYFRGFYCSMDTSRTTRVGTRIYGIHIVVASQDHVPVCVTRKITPVENDRFCCFHITIDFVVWVVNKTSFWCGESELT